MQDKLLFAAGLVALLIGLFVGVRSDNVRKAAEENLASVKGQVVAAEQQLKMEEDRNKAITEKLSDLGRKVRVTEDKLSIANNWYAGLQDTNKMLANDIYTIRLAMVEVLADLKAEPSAAGQKRVSEKLEQLVRMLDEHNASSSSGQPAAKEAEEATPAPEASEPATGGVQESTPQTEEGKPEGAPAAEAPAPEAGSPAASAQGEEAAPAEKKEKGAAEAPQEAAPAEPEQKSESGSHDAKKEEGAVRL